MELDAINKIRPAVRLYGRIDHADFVEASELLLATARIVDESESADLFVVAQSRPGQARLQEIEALRRCAPLTGIVALVGSWCEGEMRTGRPWPGVPRLYWYEFPAWWRRQLRLHSAGLCPDWARPCTTGLAGSNVRDRAGGLGVISSIRRDNANALADVMQQIGYAAVWHRPGMRRPLIRGATVGIWDGSRLGEREAPELAAFCRTLSGDAAPAIALLDFPRRECVERAMQLGASAVLGKPWLNAGLAASINHSVMQSRRDGDIRHRAA